MVVSRIPKFCAYNFGSRSAPHKSAREIATGPFSLADNLEEISESCLRVERLVLDLTKSLPPAMRLGALLEGRRAFDEVNGLITQFALEHLAERISGKCV